jgi:hypothetical protein
MLLATLINLKSEIVVKLAPIEHFTYSLASWIPGAAGSPAATADNLTSEVKLRMRFLDQETSICKLMHKPTVLQFSLKTADAFLCLCSASTLT